MMSVTQERRTEIYQQLIFARDMIQHVIDGGEILVSTFPDSGGNYKYRGETYSETSDGVLFYTVYAVCEALEDIGARRRIGEYEHRITLNFDIITVEEEKAAQRRDIEKQIAKLQAELKALSE